LVFSLVDFVDEFNVSSEFGSEDGDLVFDVRIFFLFGIRTPLPPFRREKIYRDGEYHGRSLVFREEVCDGLDELEVEVFYSALVFFDLFWSGGLFDDGTESSFGDDDGLVVFEDVELFGERFGDVLFVKLEEKVNLPPLRDVPPDGGINGLFFSSFGVF
jgi:hypothetical protein